MEAAFVFAFLAYLFLSKLPAIEFMGDESQWIASSNVFEAFIAGDINSPLWEDGYWNEVNPMVARYLIGIGRNIGGFGPNDLNALYDWHKDYAANLQTGTVPSPNLLWWSRFPMAILAACSGLILFLSVTAFAGRIVGYAAVLLFALNGAIHTHILRAMSESPMLFFICATILLSVSVFSSIKPFTINSVGVLIKHKKLWAGWLATGILLGAAAASKLNAGSIYLGLVALWILFSMKVVNFKSSGLRNGFILLGSIFLGLAAFFFFIIINPYIYPSILANTFSMLQTRIGEMQVQQAVYPQQTIVGIVPRITVLIQRIFEDYMVVHFPGAWILNLGLFLAGMVYLIRQYRPLNEFLNWNGMAILLIGGSAVLPMLVTPLDWDRYYLLPVFFGQIFIVLGLFFLVRLILRRVSFLEQPA